MVSNHSFSPPFGAMLPVRPADLGTLERTIVENDLLIPGNFRFDETFGVLDYLEGKHRYGYSFRVLLDRNLVTRVVGLVRGDEMPADLASAKIVRHAAACMAFCILAEIEIEPGMGLYEGAATHGNERAVAEHRLFRIADHVNPTHYVEVALGRLDTLPQEHLAELENDNEIASQVSREADFTKALNLWEPNYLYLLKTAELLILLC